MSNYLRVLLGGGSNFIFLVHSLFYKEKNVSIKVYFAVAVFWFYYGNVGIVSFLFRNIC